jgi:hypothetical protein
LTALVTAIDLAQAANEKRIADEINSPKHDGPSDAGALMALRSFAGWCTSRGVKWLPAMPSTVAGWIRFQEGHKIAGETILKALEAIEAAHNNATPCYANPIATSAVRSELSRVLKIGPPPSWLKTDWPLFYGLPVEVRAILERRDKQNRVEIRRLQNKVSHLLKKEKDSENAEVSSE